MRTFIGYTFEVLDENLNDIKGGKVETFRSLKYTFETAEKYMKEYLDNGNKLFIQPCIWDTVDEFLEKNPNGEDLYSERFNVSTDKRFKKIEFTLVLRGVYLLDNADDE